MKWNRIHALLLRHLWPLKRDLDMLSELLYWPFIDVISWGLASEWLSQSNSDIGGAIVSILIALLLWNIIWLSQGGVAHNLMDELWNNNLLNMFSSPLQISEWIISVLLLSLVRLIITGGFVALAIALLYTINVFSLGWWLLPFILSAMMTGWATGFFSAGIVIRYGHKAQTIIWTLPGILIPLSAVYYPVSQLPVGFRQISSLVPTTYIFEAMRGILFGNQVPVQEILLSFGMNVIYIVLAIVFFIRMFEKSKELNLSRLNS